MLGEELREALDEIEAFTGDRRYAARIVCEAIEDAGCIADAIGDSRMIPWIAKEIVTIRVTMTVTEAAAELGEAMK